MIIGFWSGGVGIIELLDKSNIVVIVGGGKNPLHSPNAVLVIVVLC